MPKAKIINYAVINDELLKKGFKQSSVNTYICKIKRVMRGLFEDMEPKISALKKSHQQVIDYLSKDEYKNSNIKKVHLIAISHLFSIYNISTNEFDKQIKDWTTLADAENVANTNEAVNEKIASIDFEAIKANIEITTDPNDRLMMTFYSYLPPLRQQDYCNLITSNKPIKDTNHINMKNRLLVIVNHKTDKIHGEKLIALPDPVIDEIKRYIKMTKSTTLLPFSSSAFTKRMTRLFGCSTSTFRKAYVSQKSPKMNSQELAHLAYIMGHKISTSVMVYRKGIVYGEPELKPDPDTMSETSEETINE